MHILIDTNATLHFKRMDQIDWCAIAGTKSCAVVVTPVLMRELEYNKVHNQSSKLRDRAHTMINWFAQRLREPDPIKLRASVTLVFDEQEPLIDFRSHRLSREIADDHFIASALDYAERVGEPVAIATADGGLAMKLRSRPIHLIELGDELRLPDAIDAERNEIRELKRQLERERHRRPDLIVRFDDGETMIVIAPDTITTPPSLDEIRNQHPPMMLAELAAPTEVGRIQVLSSRRVDRYNDQLESYFEEYSGFLDKHAEWAEQESRTVEFGFSLANMGTGPASSIDVHLDFPSHVEVMDVKDGPAEPTPPTPPERPQEGRTVVQFGTAYDLPNPWQAVIVEGEPDVSENGRRVSYSVRALKHECAYELEPILVRFASHVRMKPFEIAVSITCNEANKAVQRLFVRLGDS